MDKDYLVYLGDSYLEHYGVKGMKWRRRKNNGPSDKEVEENHRHAMNRNKMQDNLNKLNKGKSRRTKVESLQEIKESKVPKGEMPEKFRKTYNKSDVSTKLGLAFAAELVNRKRKKK